MGKVNSIYTDSEYLHYYSKVAFGIVDSTIKHYSFSCADDIIDVLSTEPPEIKFQNSKN